MEWIVITGGAGFIGSHLSEHFIARGQNVLCIDNLSTGKYENIAKLDNKNSISDFIFAECDITDTKTLSETFTAITSSDSINSKISGIYHLACPASPKAYQKDPLSTIKTCVDGTRNLLELARKLKVPILIASTSEVYGDPRETPQKEDYWGNVHSFGPRACYDVSKRMTETLAYEYIKLGVDVKIPRIFNTYGPNMDKEDGRVISNFVHQVKNNLDITVYGDGKQTRSFCYVDDTVDALIMLMKSNCNTPVNVGYPKEHTILQVAKMILEMGGNKSKIVFRKLPEDDPQRRLPNVDKIYELVGWKPKIDLEKGLDVMLKSYKMT